MFGIMRLIIFGVSIFGISFLKAQENLRLNFEEFEIFFSPKKCVDTLKFSLKGKYQGCILTLYLRECSGKSYFELKKKGNFFLTGYYENGLDTLQKYRMGKFRGEPANPTIEKYSVAILKYLYPLKTGRWTFYSEKGGKIIQVKSIEYKYIHY